MKSLPVAAVLTCAFILSIGCGGNAEVAKLRTSGVEAAKTLTLDLGGGVTMKLVLIPAGKFMMGSPENEKDRDSDEGPQREVTISRAFHMGVFEVTQEQYQAIMGTNPSNFKDAAKPVEMVSWDDAVEFCKKASLITGRTVRLPTEAEWEYACRAGSRTRFTFGDDDKGLDKYGWYDGDTWEGTRPVGQKAPNAWGLYDMHGNVYEWCSDWYDAYVNAVETDPQGPKSGDARVLRGGAWFSYPWYLRSAFRRSNDPSGRFGLYGLRVVVAP
jgi:formylglycine-generating enzyme required for sulfatase activity